MKLIDLSMTIEPHWRWPIQPELAMDHATGGPYMVTKLNIPMHAFTHVDTPLHMEPEKITVDKVPLDAYCGPAAVLDLTFVRPNQGITAEDLRRASGHLEPGDIVLLATGWEETCPTTIREHWSEAPFVTEEAARWLGEQEIKAVGFDFPQDELLREIPKRHPPREELPTHYHILGKGIYLIEYLTNLGSLAGQRVLFFAPPLKVAGAEGALTRALAVVEE